MARASAGVTSAPSAPPGNSPPRNIATKPATVIAVMLDCIMFSFSLPLLRRHDSWGLPRSLAGRQDRRRRLLGPIQAHDQINGAVGRWQPIGFLGLARRILLDVERERAVGILLHPRKHRRIDEVAVNRI